MGNFFVLSNPHARKNSHLPNRKVEFEKILDGKGTVFQTEQLDQLDQVCHELLNEEIDLIAICGGDGTNHLVCTALIKVFLEAGKPLPPLHFLKGGSMNTIAWNIGLRSPAEKTLSELSAKHESGMPFKLFRQSSIKVNDFYGFFYGNGYTSNFLDEYYNSKADSGPGRALQITTQAISAIVTNGDMLNRLSRQFEGDVTIDGIPVERTHHGLIMVSYIPYVGIMFKPLYRAYEREDRFHVIASSLKPVEVLKQLHRFFNGKMLDGRDHTDTLAAEVLIQSDMPFKFTVDGEMYEAPEVKITNGPVLDIVLS